MWKNGNAYHPEWGGCAGGRAVSSGGVCASGRWPLGVGGGVPRQAIGLGLGPRVPRIAGTRRFLATLVIFRDLRGSVPARCLGDAKEIAGGLQVSDASANEDGSLGELSGQGRQANRTGVCASVEPQGKAPLKNAREKMGAPGEGVLTSCFL